MKRFKLLLAAAIATVSLISTTAGVSAATVTKPECTIDPLPMNLWQKSFTANKDTITAKFTLKGDANCEKVMTLAVWNAPSATGHPVNEQKLFDFKTAAFKRGANTITAKLPSNCFYQADLLKSGSPTAPDGTANYAYQNGKILTNHPLHDATFGGSQKCVEKPEEPVTPETPKTPETPVVTETKDGSPVESMPDTGAGSVIAGTAGLSTSVGLAYNLYRRRKLI